MHHVDFQTERVERVPHGGARETIGRLPGAGGWLVADATHLYGTASRCGIWRLPKTGGDALLLVPRPAPIRRIFLGDDRVYWLDEESAALMSVPKVGGVPAPVRVPPAARVHDPALLDGDDFYLVGKAAISRFSRAGGGVTPLVSPASRLSTYHVAADPERIFFTARKDGLGGTRVMAIARR
jgi:hypothetical protein